MLYDTRWDKTETKVDPFKLETLVAWLETQPCDGEYVWHDCDGGCLMGIYGHAMGLGEDWHKLHMHFFNTNVTYRVACPKPHTFGAALKRARSIAA